MGVKIGNIDVTFKVGSADCAVYLGDTLVYSGGTPTHDYSLDYLTFIAEEDGTFSFSKSGMSYSVDDGATWTELASGGNTPTVSSGDSILWKANGTNGGSFSSTGQFKVQGNAHSLLFGDNFSRTTDLSGNTLISLFSLCKGLTSAENLVLPATTLEYYCYQSMFSNCTSLTTAPELPATTLANYCYRYMFRGCTSLTTAPQLPATTLANNCYDSMFFNCESLTNITCLATDKSATNCTSNWVRGVSSTGTFIKNPSMNNWPSGNSGIPSNWTVVDYQE